jgi:hypothetical protein
MTSPVDPVRRIATSRKVGRAQVHVGRGADEAGAAGDAAEPAPGPAPDPADAAAFAAHMLGQERRRGVRAGHAVLDTAKSAYSRTEWSGAADRRAPKGGLTRTKI